jgi:hypothetical protein
LAGIIAANGAISEAWRTNFLIDSVGVDGHFVVETHDGQAEERNGVVGAEDAFVVYVDTKKLVQRLYVANAPMIRAGRNDAIETGAAPCGTG